MPDKFDPRRPEHQHNHWEPPPADYFHDDPITRNAPQPVWRPTLATALFGLVVAAGLFILLWALS